MDKSSRNLDELIANLRVLLPKLKTQYHVRSLEIFGSFVRDETQADSDLDLLVTFDDIPTLFQFVGLENHLSDELGVHVDLVMKDGLKPHIRKHILDEAQLI